MGEKLSISPYPPSSNLHLSYAELTLFKFSHFIVAVIFLLFFFKKQKKKVVFSYGAARLNEISPKVYMLWQ